MITDFDLDCDELKFLDQHGLSSLDFIDGRGMTKTQYKPVAKKHYCDFVLGNTSVCGHRLKTRNGHCIQCRPERITMQTGVASEYIYAARAVDRTIFKVGRSRDPSRRMEQLNDAAYGGSRSWKLVFKDEISYAKELEAAWHRQLSAFRKTGTQTKDGELKWAKELFTCTEKELRAAYIAALQEIANG